MATSDGGGCKPGINSNPGSTVVSTSHQQQFSDYLVTKYIETSTLSTRLQLQLAQKDDELTNVRAQLHEFQYGTANQNARDLEHQIKDLQKQLLDATDRTQAAETSLAASVSRFDGTYKNQQAQIKKLEKEIEDAAAQEQSHDIVVGRAAELDDKLAATKAELQTVKVNFSRLQKQFEAEKRENSKRRNFPATAVDKYGDAIDDDDQDEEEFESPHFKQEFRSSQRHPELLFDNASVGNPSPDVPSDRVAGDTSSKTASSPVSPLRARKVTGAHNSSPPTKTARRPKRSAASGITQKKTQKRRRSRKEEQEDDLEDNYPTESDDTSPSPSGKQSPLSSNINAASLTELKQTFHFLAITQHNPDGTFGGYDSEQDLHNCLDELWHRIHSLVNKWGETSDDWRLELEEKLRSSHSSSSSIKPCISSKLKIEGRENGRSIWRAGCEGKFACRRCVREDLPCFTWDGSDYLLLPLHVEDRRFEVAGVEIRHWVNLE